jgi:hypothetical protein
MSLTPLKKILHQRTILHLLPLLYCFVPRQSPAVVLTGEMHQHRNLIQTLTGIHRRNLALSLGKKLDLATPSRGPGCKIPLRPVRKRCRIGERLPRISATTNEVDCLVIFCCGMPTAKSHAPNHLPQKQSSRSDCFLFLSITQSNTAFLLRSFMRVPHLAPAHQTGLAKPSSAQAPPARRIF